MIDPHYQGPIGFSGALNTRLRDAGLNTVSLIGGRTQSGTKFGHHSSPVLLVFSQAKPRA